MITHTLNPFQNQLLVDCTVITEKLMLNNGLLEVAKLIKELRDEINIDEISPQECSDKSKSE